MRTRPALLAVLATVLGAVLLVVGWLVLQPSAAGIGQVPAPISVPAPSVLPPVPAPATTTPPATPTDVVPPPPLDDDDDDDDGDTDGPDDVDDDGED